MIILDTNVISEGLRVRPHAAVRSWLDQQIPDRLFLCAPVLAELRYGIERLPLGGRRAKLDQLVSIAERELFAHHILPVDRDCAYEFGRIVAERARVGRPIMPMDAMIAAVAVANAMAVATRDIEDFTGLGIELINPFEP
jgi:toxin FitB